MLRFAFRAGTESNLRADQSCFSFRQLRPPMYQERAVAQILAP
jgi:hypothetical protein